MQNAQATSHAHTGIPDPCNPVRRREPGFADAPRQICPPRSGLSSMMPTRRRFSVAHAAAAIPAGPPPMTSTSKRSEGSLVMGAYLHARLANDLASSRMGVVVDYGATLEADSHS